MSCPFCEELATGLLPDREGVDITSRVVRSTEHFVALADISPLVVGHLIIIPRAHVLSVGHLGQERREELRELVAELRAELVARFAEPAVFEHGSDSMSDGGGCVAHAHLHLVPAPVDLGAALAQWQVRRVESFDDLEQWSAADRAYVFAGDHLGRGLVADGLAGIPKQFLRIEIARQLGIEAPWWDWRRHILAENLRATVEALGTEPARAPR
jgi:diadenosine tetraphosphate (Ap4A) HIT family hydrolase